MSQQMSWPILCVLLFNCMYSIIKITVLFCVFVCVQTCVHNGNFAHTGIHTCKSTQNVLLKFCNVPTYFSDEQVRSVPADTLKCYMKELMPGTRYNFYVVANYSNGHLPHSLTASQITKGYGQDNRKYSSVTQNLLSVYKNLLETSLGVTI